MTDNVGDKRRSALASVGAVALSLLAMMLPAYAQSGLTFTANDGQIDERVKFYVRTTEADTYFTTDGIYFDLSAPDVSLALHIPGGDLSRIRGQGRLPGTVNHFIGHDQRLWRRGIATYGAVRYQAIHPGVDLLFRGQGGALEYDVLVAPGADPRSATFSYRGADGLRLNDQGELVIMLGDRELVQHRPVAYQPGAGGRQMVAARFRLINAGPDAVYGFEVGDYDRSLPLVIDPVLAYSTYLGGSHNDHGHLVAVDAAGNAYVTGETRSLNFPLASAAQGVQAGNEDVFVTKLDPTGSTVLFSTYLGGSNHDEGYGIAVDGSGNGLF